MGAWTLFLMLTGMKEPVLTSEGYRTQEQCERAMDELMAADSKIRGRKDYDAWCIEQGKERVEPSRKE